MKIGIITHYYNSTNYGGNLQAYALAKYLNGRHEAEQICYVNTYVQTKSRWEQIKEIGVLKFIKKIIIWAISHIKKFFIKRKNKQISSLLSLRKNAILEFNHMIPHSKECYNGKNIENANSEYDVFITGSDQVWHPDAVNPAYLLKFVERKKKISYAASLAVSELAKPYQKVLTESLKDYSAISVREGTAVALLEPLCTPKPIEVVVDPVFLLEKDDWESIVSNRLIESPYLFCYFLGDNSISRRLAEQYAVEHNLIIVTLPFLGGTYRSCDKDFGHLKLYEISPNDFLSLIKYAQCIFTDSFHATAFSFIFEKQFFVFNRGKGNKLNSRIYDIVKLFEQLENFCDDDEKCTLQYLENLPNINYKKSRKNFEILKATSKQFLETSLMGTVKIYG